MTSSGLMRGKRGLIMGVANERSIAWGIAEALHAAGAELAFTYQGETFRKRVVPLKPKPTEPRSSTRPDDLVEQLFVIALYCLFLGDRVLEDEELPALGVAAARSRLAGRQDLEDKLVRHRVGLQPPHRPHRMHDVENIAAQRNVVRHVLLLGARRAGSADCRQWSPGRL